MVECFMNASDKAIIFGSSGQDGIYMTDLCKRKGIEPIGVSRRQGFGLCGSVCNFEFVKNIIKEHKPRYIFHFAANSTTRHEALFENHETISTGSLNILENVKLHSPASKVLITGSGLQFRNEGKPISESTPFDAGNAYAVSRIQSVFAARYFRSLGIQAYVAYLFHHESPLRHSTHVSKMISNKIKEIRNGRNTKIVIGDSTVEKEWGFAGDIVKGIFTLVSQETVSEAVIGTGIAYTINDYITECLSLSGIDPSLHVESQPKFKAEYKKLLSNPQKINLLGWRSETSFKQLVQIMLSD